MMNIFSKYRVSPWVRNLQVASATNLVVHELEKKILQSTKYIHMLYRYVDDIDTLVFWTGSLAQLEDFIQFINTSTFTGLWNSPLIDEASVQSIQFLDLVIYTKGNDLMKQESWTTSNVIQRRQKMDNFYTDLHTTHNPSSTVSFEVRSSAMQI